MATELTRANRFDEPLRHIQQLYHDSKSTSRSSSTSDRVLDAIVYINLKDRPDRLKLLEPTLTYLRPMAREVHRIDAVKHQQGGKGCALSHLKTFEFIMKNKFVNTLVLEDDVGLDMEPEELEHVLRTFLNEQGDSYDCLICGSHPAPNKFETDEIYRRMCGCFTEPTSSYVIHLDYVPVLHYLWKHCADNLKETMDGENYYRYAIDQAWYRLFPIHNFYWIVGNPLRQLSNMSDITGVVHEEYPPFKLSWKRRHELGLVNKDPASVSFDVEKDVCYATMSNDQIDNQVRKNLRVLFDQRGTHLMKELQACINCPTPHPPMHRVRHALYLFNSILQHF